MLEKSSGAVTFVSDPGARHYGAVSVAGEFNGWNAGRNPLSRGGDGKWRGSLPLAAGQYQFKYVADGNWLNDPQADGEVPNGQGGTNSVVKVAAAAPPPTPPAPKGKEANAPAAAPAPAPAPAPQAAAPAPAPQAAAPAEPPPPAPPRPRIPPVKNTGFTRPVQRVYIKKPPES